MKPGPLIQALDAESYEYLSITSPLIAEAIEAAVAAGHTPAQIKRVVLQHVGPDRLALAERCAQAAAYVERTQR